MILKVKLIVNANIKCKLNFVIAKNSKQMFPMQKQRLSLFQKNSFTGAAMENDCQ